MLKLLFDNGDQHVSGDSAPDLCFHGVLAVADETLDAQILFDPLEEQLDLPAALVKRGNREGTPPEESTSGRYLNLNMGKLISKRHQNKSLRNPRQCSILARNFVS